MLRMKKTDAITLLGGTPTSAADAIGISYQAFSQWPDVLPRRLRDRVQAAIARKHLSPEVLGENLDDQPQRDLIRDCAPDSSVSG